MRGYGLVRIGDISMTIIVYSIVHLRMRIELANDQQYICIGGLSQFICPYVAITLMAQGSFGVFVPLVAARGIHIIFS